MKRLQEYKDDLKRIGVYVLFGLAPTAYIVLSADAARHVIAALVAFLFLIYVLFKRY